PGTVMTVRELAEAMISISDNTATDHLIDLVGRAAVEDMLVPMGNDALDRNRPFLTTREMFVLKFGDPELGREFVSADESGRRAILADRVAAAPLPTAGGVDLSQPVLVDELEWFASPTALCDAMVWLTADPTALEILSMNPGVPATGSSWDTIAFKGGSEPGLITMVWWTSTEDGRAFVTAGSVVSETGPVDEFEAANLLAVLRDLGPALDEVGGSD
ncbi:MAG: serine hydrolase, partial [Acidimicrobiales bacterium]